jgi:hypothetical protein
MMPAQVNAAAHRDKRIKPDNLCAARDQWRGTTTLSDRGRTVTVFGGGAETGSPANATPILLVV